MSNKIIVVGGGKGGVGKTSVVLGVVDMLITRGEQVVVVESDDSNPDAYKALSKITKCEICNLDSESGYMNLCGIVEANADATIVVNTAARATKSLVDFGYMLADAAKELKRELVMLWVINRQRDSVELLKEFLDGATGYAATYAVLNLYFGNTEKFTRFETSKQQARVTGKIVYPELNDLVADKLIENRFALSNAECLSIAERSVLGRYRAAVEAAFKGVI